MTFNLTSETYFRKSPTLVEFRIGYKINDHYSRGLNSNREAVDAKHEFHRRLSDIVAALLLENITVYEVRCCTFECADTLSTEVVGKFKIEESDYLFISMKYPELADMIK